MFRRSRSLLDAMIRESRLSVMFPTHYFAPLRTEGGSRADLKAVQSLLGTPEVRSVSYVTIRDIFHYGRDLTGPGLVDHLQSTDWWQDLNSDCAVITIGSPYVSYASIRALGLMLDVDAPFEKQEVSSRQELPIRFYCPANICRSENAFTIDRKQLKQDFPSEFATMDPGDRALVIGNRCFIARPYGESINPIVAQYRNGHLRVVFSAIFAPATAGIAELAANRAIMHMPDSTSSDNSKVMIALVKTHIKHRDPGEGLSARVQRDSRELVDQRVFYERIWSKANDGRWRVEPGDECVSPLRGPTSEKLIKSRLYKDRDLI